MHWNTANAKQLGATLRRLRGGRGLSQENLAFAAGITKNQLQLLEAGRGSGRKDSETPSNPRLSTLSGLANAFDLSVSELLREAEL